jgi:glycosyltransferase involved in cell wall biosynthesis
MIREIALIPAATRPHLMLVGNATPTDRQSMQGLAQRFLPGGTTILTSLQRDEMPGIYRCADIFAHAALREPFGIVLPEAMASGLPVVGHRFPVTQWIVGDGGTVVDMEREGSAAEIIGRWCRSPAERADAGRRARNRARGHFSVRSVLPVYREAYASITGNPC